MSILGSSTALWMAISKKADRADLARLVTKLDQRIDRLETRLETTTARRHVAQTKPRSRVARPRATSSSTARATWPGSRPVRVAS